MLRIGVQAAIEPHEKSITRFLGSILRANKRGGRFLFASSSKSKTTQEAAPREQHGSRFEKGWCEMKTNKLIAATLAASMAVAALPTASQAAIVLPAPGHVYGGGGATAPWAIFACAGGIIASALVANYRDNRELTTPEAWTCGLLFWFEQPMPNKKKHH
jgi:hypothetical protein